MAPVKIPEFIPTQHHWEAQPELRDRKELKKFANLDLTGVMYGRFTVVGLSKIINGRWIVRCACGDYETRKARTIQQKLDDGMCAICRHNEKIKKGLLRPK